MSQTITAVPARLLAITAGPPPEPAASPAEGPAPAPDGAPPSAGTPGPSAEPSGPQGPPPPLVVTGLAEVLEWAAQTCLTAGDPLSVHADSRLRQLHVHAASTRQLLIWADLLGVRHDQITEVNDPLGPTLHATAITDGWVLNVHLSGPFQELP